MHEKPFYMQKKIQRIQKRYQRSKKRHIRRIKLFSRHPVGVPVFTFVALVLLSCLGYLLFNHIHGNSAVLPDTHVVIISHDHIEQIVPSRDATVSQLLKKLNIKLSQGDVVEPESTTEIVQDNFRINIYRAHPVEIVDGTQHIYTFSAASTPRSIAQQTGSTVYAEDAVSRTPVTDFVDSQTVGEQILITRSQPINLNLYGTPVPTRTLAKTVGGMLQEKNIKLAEGESVQPDVTASVSPGEQIFILQKGVHIISQAQEVPAPVQNVDDNNLTFGSKAIRQTGSNGTQVVTYQVKDDPATGKETGRTVIQTVVVTPPVPQIVAIGKNVNIPQDKLSIMQAVGISPGDYQYVDYVVSHEGGWSGAQKYNGAGSGAYGICQALPGSKMASAGADWASNPVTQLRWCDGYAGKYGGWGGAYNYWVEHHYW
jgi:uncharacterized protein YabE (DUF348 family)